MSPCSPPASPFALQHSSPKSPKSARSTHSGPSAFLDVVEPLDAVPPTLPINSAPSPPQAKSEGSSDDDVVWPVGLVEALAAYCEGARCETTEVRLHFYPFGGIKKTMDFVEALEAGSLHPLEA